MRAVKTAAIVATTMWVLGAVSSGVTTAGVLATEIGMELETAAPSGDLNGDGSTNSADLRLMLAVWRGEVSARSVGVNQLDVNGDYQFNIEDVMELARLIEAERERGTSSVPPLLLGDVNGDQRVDVADLYQLGLFIAGSPVELRNPAAADIDGNGVIDIRDLTEFAKQLGGGAWSYDRT